jgi:hypothetical protein
MSSSGIKSKTVGFKPAYFGISISDVADTKTRLFNLFNLEMITTFAHETQVVTIYQIHLKPKFQLYLF